MTTASASLGVPASAQSRRAVTAAVIGNVLEWYDFAVYGYFAAAIGRHFFCLLYTSDAADE